MAYDDSWARRLRSGAQPEFLVTIVIGHSYSAWKPQFHPSRFNNAIRATSFYGAVDTSYGTFLPTVVNELSVKSGIDPIKRTFTETSVEIELSADADMPAEIIESAGTMMLWGEVDLWLPGMPVELAKPLLIGRVTEGTYNRRTGHTTLHLVDGDPVREVRYPPGDMKLSRANFGDIPQMVDGVWPRVVILGPWEGSLACPQISATPRQFYICDHPLAKPPATVEVNGIKTTIPYRILTKRLPGPNLDALEEQQLVSIIEFAADIDTGVPYVTCSGGVGLDLSMHPAMLLLEKYGGYLVDRHARSVLNSLTIDTSIMLNASDNVLTIAKDRILRQSPYIGGFRGGQFVVQSLDPIPMNVNLEVGVNLFDVDDPHQSQTDTDSVYNAIEITYNRNILSTNLIDVSKQSFHLDKSNAPLPLGNLLSRSEQLYGRRQLLMDFPDIRPSDINVPPVVRQVALQTLSLTAFQHQRYSYPCDTLLALSLPFNAVMPLTDASRDINGTRVRLVEKEIERHKITTTFISEDA